MADTHPLAVYIQRERITQAELAGRLGVTTAAVTRYLKGDRQIARSLWPKFSEVTGIPVAALAGLERWPAEAAE